MRFVVPLVVISVIPLVGCGTIHGLSSPISAPLDDRTCLIRAMYFESNRSSDQGLRAVGTVVMNRVASRKYPRTICGVVGQPGQFAAGVLTLPMRPSEAEKASRIADEVLAGKREPSVGNAMFFHQAGLTFSYPNMHYVLVAGGNAFYEKRSPTNLEPALPALAAVSPSPSPVGQPVGTMPDSALPAENSEIAQAILTDDMPPE